jgi:hypothetical protein
MNDLAPQVSALHPAPARRSDRWYGLTIIAVTFVACLALSVWAKYASRPETSPPPGPPTTQGIVGWAKAVDPVKTLPRARELTRRKVLRGIVMEGVRSDGTLDLTEGPARVRYAFWSPPGEGPQPAREPGTLARRHYCGSQSVIIRKEGLVAEPDQADGYCPPQAIEALPEPHCTTAGLWEQALRRGAPKDRLARIEYYRSTSGPAWRFDIPGSHHRFSLYGDCVRELTPRESSGIVP